MPFNAAPKRVQLLTAAITDETTSPWVDCSAYAHVVVYVSGAGTTSSGVLTIEEADWGPDQVIYGGTPSAITTVNASDVTGDVMKAIHLPDGAYAFVRTRVSTVIGGGGSVSASLRAS